MFSTSAARRAIALGARTSRKSCLPFCRPQRTRERLDLGQPPCRHVSSSAPGEHSEDELGKECIIFDNIKGMKYGRVPGALAVTQFYTAGAFGAYILYTAEAANLVERLYMTGLSVALSGLVLVGVNSIAKSIVVEIRTSDEKNCIEIMTLGTLGYEINEYKITDMVDPTKTSNDNSPTILPGYMLLKHRSGKTFMVDVKGGDVTDMQQILRLSRGKGLKKADGR